MKEFKCNHCDKVFARLSKLNNHLLKNHNDNWVWSCNICQKEFSNHKALNAHKNSHLDRPKRGPNKNSLTGESVTTYRKRRSLHHDCRWCGKIFESGYKLGGHTRLCENNPNRQKNYENVVNALKEASSRPEVREKMRESLKKYLSDNPHMIPYIRNHSSKKSFPEKVFENLLVENDIDGWSYNFLFGRYAYDYAFEKIKLDVEIDGQQHLSEKHKKHDEIRDTFSKENGWYVHRISAKDLRHKENHQKIVENLKSIIQNLTNNL